jgi:alkylhydroperoxidase family enzyme
MPRIGLAYELDEKELEGLTGPERSERQLAAIKAHRPEVSAALGELQKALKAGTLDPRLTELVRLRIAFHNQCRSCMSVRLRPGAVDEGTVCSLERPEEADDLSESEKSAIRYADLFATDHLAIDEAVFDDLREYYDEGEIVELQLVCAQYVGMGRVTATWAMHEYLDERFQDDSVETHTPWLDQSVPSGS